MDSFVSFLFLSLSLSLSLPLPLYFFFSFENIHYAYDAPTNKIVGMTPMDWNDSSSTSPIPYPISLSLGTLTI
ncbi:hypothetical protein EDD21DRAFT_382923 [Dissophora ornata]|nr:hypothetical protein EDD21DRAFT_382923 [Dissophora ornata]